MSATIMLSENKTFDVRTVDFNLIVNALRINTRGSEISKGLLETIDVFGMNMICVDELDASGLKIFGELLKEFGATLGTENMGLFEFIENVCAEIDLDERVVSDR